MSSAPRPSSTPPPALAADIEAVLFDYGMVLTGPPDPAAWERMKSVLNADEKPFHQAYWASRHEYDRGGLNSESYWRTVAGSVGRNLVTEHLHELTAADTALWTQPNAEMIAWAAALQRAGIRTGILSNIGDAMESGIREHCPWLANFAHHTFSHRLGIAKPELAIYIHAAQGLGVAPGHILFIDDRLDNIEAARLAGMLAIQYTSHDSFVRAMNERGLGALLHPEPQKSAPNTAKET